MSEIEIRQSSAFVYETETGTMGLTMCPFNGKMNLVYLVPCSELPWYTSLHDVIAWSDKLKDNSKRMLQFKPVSSNGHSAHSKTSGICTMMLLQATRHFV